MKKTFAYILLALHLFNLGGYLLLFAWFIHRADVEANEHINKNMYKASELVEIKIPVTLLQIHP